MAPRTDCGCQPVASTASAMVAPVLRLSSLISRACLVPARTAGGVLSFGLALASFRAARPVRFCRRDMAAAAGLRDPGSGATPMVSRPASVITRVIRRPSSPSRQAWASRPAGCSATRPRLTRLLRTLLAAPLLSFSEFGSGSTTPPSLWAAAERMTSCRSVSLGMWASLVSGTAGDRGACTP